MPRRQRAAQRAAAQAAAQSMKTAPQTVPDASDEEMVDAPSTAHTAREDHAEEETTAGEPASQEAERATDGDDDAEAEGEAEADGQHEDGTQAAAEGTEADTPTADTEQGSRQESPRQTGRVSALAPPRRRRIGRPPKNKPPDWDAPVEGETSRIEVTTPVRRRGRGRPSAGGRWARTKGGPSHVTQVPVDKEGNMMDVINDEVAIPDDPEGETKVDKMGNLQGGREYRVRIFTILNRGDRQYMLSTEPARCIGFRDSYLFFQKHKLLYKIIIDDDAKRDLIERDIIPHSYKGRAIGVVTARSVFREFGAKIIVGGRKVVDDYHAQAARERGDIEGELAVPDDKLPGPGETYDRNRYVAWHGASAVYHSGAPSVPLEPGKAVDSKKRKVTVTGDNWMLEHARESSRFNSMLSSVRRENLEGMYDIHTNAVQYPRIMQPTQARWEPIPPPEHDETSRRRRLLDSASSVLNHPTNGALEESATDKEPRLNGEPEKHAQQASDSPETIFPPVPALFSRNFGIHDVHFESPADSTLGNPGPDGDVHDLGPNGLVSTSTEHGTPAFHMSQDILDELLPECRAAYVEAAAREWEWKSRWRGEKASGYRATLPLNYSWNP